MPASGFSTLSLTGGTGSRTWTATAATQDTAAGSSVVITVAQSTTGVAPTAPTSLDLEVRIGSTGAVLRTYPLTLPLTSQAVTFFFTTDGTSGGAARWGTVRMNIRARQTGGVASTQYDVDVDGTFNTAPTLYPTVARDKGWMRGLTTAVQSLSNVALGGAVPASFAHPDPLYLRTTLGTSGYESVTFTASIGAVRSATAATATATVDVSWTGNSTTTGRVNMGFLAAATSLTTDIVAANHALSGIAATAFTSKTQVTKTFDPRLTIAHYMQRNDSTYPASLPNAQDAVTPKQRRSDQSGHLFEQVTNARGEGQVVTLTTTLTHTSGFNIALASRVTGTVNGESGWTTVMMTWIEAGPSGYYTKDAAVTGPTDIAGPTYWIGAADPDTYLLVAQNPDISVFAGGGPVAASGHAHKGEAMVVAGGLVDTSTRQMVTPDASPAPLVALFRLDQATGRAQYLKSDYTWVNAAAATFDTFTLTAGADGITFLRVFTSGQTGGADWNDGDLLGLAQFTYMGYPYKVGFFVTVLGTYNDHDAADAAPSLSLNDLTDVATAGVTAGDVLLYSGSQWEPGEVDMPTAAEIADAVWDEGTAASRATGSYGELVRTDLDATVSSCATQADVTTLLARLSAGRALNLDNLVNLDAAISALGSPAQAAAVAGVQADTTSLLSRLTAPRATALDLIDVALSTRASQASVDALGSPVQDDDARLDSLDATVSSRATQASVDAIDPGDAVQADDPRLDYLDVPMSSRQPLDVEGGVT